jgi:hypothetical protein
MRACWALPPRLPKPLFSRHLRDVTDGFSPDPQSVLRHGIHKVITMAARYISVAVDNAARACSRWPVVA